MAFNFDNTQIRVVQIDGEPWLMAKGATDALGYKNSRNALANHVSELNRMSVAISYTSSDRVVERNFISAESGARMAQMSLSSSYKYEKKTILNQDGYKIA